MPRLGALPRVADMVAAQRPTEPMHCIRPSTLRTTAERFVSGFPGHVLYAVKCNPEPAVLRALHRGGIRHFDAASPGEIRLIRQLFPEAAIHYMHPIKAPSAIRAAYFDHGVRDFSLDSIEEIDKILEATDHAADLGLHVRLAMPKGQAVYDLSGKFGAAPEQAAELLRRADAVAAHLGLCFHVGSQCLDPMVYERALALAGTVLAAAGVDLDSLDVGGGFPVSYPGVTPPDLDLYFAAISRGVAALGLPAGCQLWCEPGRALVAQGGSLVVQVEARRKVGGGDVLYINDGIYGSLSDAGVPAFRFPARVIRAEPARAELGDGPAELTGFAFYGPTCDSADFMAGPFDLPSDIKVGDWIEIGQLGAYSACLRTAFNGFDRALIVEVADQPLLETPGHLDLAGPPLRMPARPPRRIAA